MRFFIKVVHGAFPEGLPVAHQVALPVELISNPPEGVALLPVNLDEAGSLRLPPGLHPLVLALTEGKEAAVSPGRLPIIQFIPFASPAAYRVAPPLLVGTDGQGPSPTLFPLCPVMERRLCGMYIIP